MSFFSARWAKTFFSKPNQPRLSRNRRGAVARSVNEAKDEDQELLWKLLLVQTPGGEPNFSFSGAEVGRFMSVLTFKKMGFEAGRILYNDLVGRKETKNHSSYKCLLQHRKQNRFQHRKKSKPLDVSSKQKGGS